MEKAEGPKTKPRPKPKHSDKAQSERFIEAARTLGVEKTGKAFDEAFEKVAVPRKPKQ